MHIELVIARPALHCLMVLLFLGLGSSAEAQKSEDVRRLSLDASRLYQAGKYAEAVPIAQRVIALYEGALDGSQHNLATALNNLAELYRMLGRHGEAEPFYRRSLAIREQALGPEHPDVAQSLNNLGSLYEMAGRHGEAEALYKRSLGIREKALKPDHPDIGQSLNNLAGLYHADGRHEEAEPLFLRALAIAEKAGPRNLRNLGSTLNNLGEVYGAQGRLIEAEHSLKRGLAVREKSLSASHPDVLQSISNLAALYDTWGRDSEALPLHMRSLALREKALGPEHVSVAVSLNNLASLYGRQRRYGDAEPLFKRALAISERWLGAEHPKLIQLLDNLADLAFSQSDWPKAADYWRRSTSLIAQQARRDAVGTTTASGTSPARQEIEKLQFRALIKAVYRLDGRDGRNEAVRARETFLLAQGAEGSAAAASLALMSARAAGGNARLSALVRERQDLVDEWRQRDKIRDAAIAMPPGNREQAAEAENQKRLAFIDDRIAAIDQGLRVEFPDYAALVQPTPLEVEDVQQLLKDSEVLVLILDTSEVKPAPEETFVWIISKTAVHWQRSELGATALGEIVMELRCGLDASAWEVDGPASCKHLLSMDTPADGWLPFDLARAHAIYNTVFGQVQHLIEKKDLLVVASGPLAELPLHVLAKSIPQSGDVGPRRTEMALLGARLGDPDTAARARLPANSGGGAHIQTLTFGDAAHVAGLKADDILLEMAGEKIASADDAVRIVRKQVPRSQVRVRFWRDGREQQLSVTLGSVTRTEWRPLYFDATTVGPAVGWLARDHSVEMLPAVASLKSLRRVTRPSAAPKPMIGFGNPLLDGDQNDPKFGAYYKEQAALARAKQSCAEVLGHRVTSLTRGTRRAAPLETRQGRPALADIKMQAPLHDTADELCSVANAMTAASGDILLGAAATEANIKQLNSEGRLAQYRVLHFATHGVMAGEISGTGEPGLILTPPTEQTETDDGYLSASEVASLKLDADWVILSACNTAAGGAQSAEVLSGLARAFIYAGARALLVSHWSVDSAATVKLITSAVGAIARDEKLGRAEALRRAMLAMIDNGAPHEAHPAFWAPFVVVGEGAAAR